MKKILLLLLTSAAVQADVTEYRHLKDYAIMTHNILISFIIHNPTASAGEVRAHLRKITTVFKDARDMGYDRPAVIRCTYCIALDQDPRDEKMLDALREELKSYKFWREIIYWATFGCSVFSTVATFGLIVITGRMYRDWLRH